jgi:filamentous hemagglutinin
MTGNILNIYIITLAIDTPDNDVWLTTPLSFNELEAFYGTKMSGWTNRSALESTLLSSGNGTRAVIYGMDEAGTTAHVWNAVVRNGKINYIDGQIGRGGAGNFDYFPNLQFGIIE